MTKALEIAQVPNFLDANTTALVVNATSYNIGSSFIANTTGVYHTGTVNSASYTVGSSFVVNSTAIVGTGYANVTTSVNSALLTVGSSFVANTTGAYHTGLINAASFRVGSSFIANTSVTVSPLQVVISGGGATSEGGQITLGYGNNLASSITGQANNTFNLDIIGGNTGSTPLFRAFFQNGDSSIKAAFNIANTGRMHVGSLSEQTDSTLKVSGTANVTGAVNAASIAIGPGGITFGDASVQTTAAAAGATGVPVLLALTSSGTWTKPATVKAIKVTVVGGGGAGGSAGPAGAFGAAGGGGGGGGSSIKVYPAPSLPGPQPYTVGGAGATSSFGAAPATVISATGGSAGGNGGASAPGGAGGSGSGGDLNLKGSGGTGMSAAQGPSPVGAGGAGGSSILGGGAAGVGTAPGNAGQLYGGGGSGGGYAGAGPTISGGAGAAGIVVVEEFY